MIYHVKKHPSAGNLATCVQAADTDPVPDGYEAMTREEFLAWKSAEIAAGWAPPAPAPEPEPVPAEVPMWALRAVLDLEGLTPSINATLAQLPEPTKTIGSRVWEYGNYMRRDSPMLNQLAAGLGKTSAEVDAYFRTAATLAP